MIACRILFCPTEERTARELQQLPQAEREQVWADMTGDPRSIYYRTHAESQEMIMERMQELIQEVFRVVKNPPSSHVGSAHALELALEADPNYVLHPKFLLMFLRADDFQPPQAAIRMIHHFQKKLELFGPDKIARTILLSDLDDDDMESLLSGGIQILTKKDRATRAVIFTRSRLYKYKQRNNMVRASPASYGGFISKC